MAHSPSHAHRTRRRFWAWTLTITAALLAVVWVGSMKAEVSLKMPQFTASVSAGSFGFIRIVPDLPVKQHVWMAVLDEWAAVWWFFQQDHTFQSTRHTFSYWRIPLWPFVLLTGVPGVWLLLRTRQPTNANACSACGYDKTGLPTANAPCPECGKGDDAVRW